jgi:outer membrane protein OmpA-like peptidoglycan-associated protein
MRARARITQSRAPRLHTRNGARRAPARRLETWSLVGNAAFGRALDANTRADAERRFGVDFSDVRLHVGNEAAEAARARDARAFTVGRDVVFGEGQFAPGTSEGRELLTHELAHVVQQARGRAGGPTVSKDTAEARAGSIARNDPSSVTAPILGAVSPGVQCAPLEPERPAIGYRPPATSTTSYVIDEFGFNEAKLDDDDAGGGGAMSAKLASIAKDLEQAPLGFHDFITIVGHADAPGTPEANRAVGQQRADEVRRRIIAMGVSEDAVHALTLGASASVTEKPGKQPKDRRVTVSITRRVWDFGLRPERLLSRPKQSEPRAADEYDPLPEEKLPSLPFPFGGGDLRGPRKKSGVDLDRLQRELEQVTRRYGAPKDTPVTLRDVVDFLDKNKGITGLARDASEVIVKNGLVTREQMDEAAKKGVEEGLKAGIDAVLQSLIGAPTKAPPNETGPALTPIPQTIIAPTIPFDPQAKPPPKNGRPTIKKTDRMRAQFAPGEEIGFDFTTPDYFKAAEVTILDASGKVVGEPRKLEGHAGHSSVRAPAKGGRYTLRIGPSNDPGSTATDELAFGVSEPSRRK